MNINKLINKKKELINELNETLNLISKAKGKSNIIVSINLKKELIMK